MKYQFNNEEHLHTLDGHALTGTSSIGNVLAKPALIQWAANMACEYVKNAEIFSLANEKGKFVVSQEELLKVLAEAKYAHKKKKEKAAEEGTDLHAELEKYVKAQLHDDDGLTFDPKIQPFIDWANENVKRFIASEAHCYDEDLFVGGITDCVAELMDGRYAVIDFKSSREAYITHFIQASGYAIQIEKNGLFSEDGEHSKKLDKPIEVLIVIPFGAKNIVPDVRYNVQDYKNGFRAAVTLYRVMGFDKAIKENAM